MRWSAAQRSAAISSRRMPVESMNSRPRRSTTIEPASPASTSQELLLQARRAGDVQLAEQLDDVRVAVALAAQDQRSLVARALGRVLRRRSPCARP